MSSKWCDIRVIEFLEIYEKHECLWNPRVESYKNKIFREAALDAIIKELNLPGLTPNDIKLKIKSIRTTYKRELSAVLKAEEGEDGSCYIPKLFWFKRADTFLRDVSLSRRSARMGLKTETEKDNSIKKTLNCTQAPCKRKATEDLENAKSESNEKNEEVFCNESTQQDALQDVDLYSSTDPAEYQQQPQQNLHCKSLGDDEFVIFCRSVAAQLRAIPDAYSRSVAKFKIQQILFEAETGHYRKSAYITIPVAQEINHL